MTDFEKRKKIVEKFNLPETCIYCKGLGFNCQETVWKSYIYDDNLNKTNVIEYSTSPACEKYLKYNSNPIVKFIDTTKRR